MTVGGGGSAGHRRMGVGQAPPQCDGPTNTPLIVNIVRAKVGL